MHAATCRRVSTRSKSLDSSRQVINTGRGQRQADALLMADANFPAGDRRPGEEIRTRSRTAERILDWTQVAAWTGSRRADHVVSSSVTG